jgi:hypothetical protein
LFGSANAVAAWPDGLCRRNAKNHSREANLHFTAADRAIPARERTRAK